MGLSVLDHGDISYIIAVDSQGGVAPMLMSGYGFGEFEYLEAK